MHFRYMYVYLQYSRIELSVGYSDAGYSVLAETVV